MKEEGSAVSPSRAARAEAAAWVARLHSTALSHETQSGWRAWLSADPSHRRAFELATEAWEVGGAIPLASRTPLHVSRNFYPAIAATLLLAIVGAWLVLAGTASPVSTSVGEQRLLTLPDGTRIFLNTDTRLLVEADDESRRVKLESGEALFDVAKDPERPFIVTAGDRQVTALGTSFVVRREEQRLAVTLMEGKVEVSSALPHAASGNGTVLVPGQRLTFVNRKAPTLDRPAIEMVTAFRRGEIVLDKTRLQDAVDEMNRYSAVKLVVDDAAVADIRVSGLFRAGDSERFAQALAEAYGLLLTRGPRRVLISPPPG